MSHALVLQAIPPASLLYKELATNGPIGGMYAKLFSTAGGPLMLACSPQMLQQELAHVAAEVANVFHLSQDAMLRAADHFMLLVTELVCQDPSLVGRRVFMEGSQWDIEDRCADYLAQRYTPTDSSLITLLLFGERLLTPSGAEGVLGVGIREVTPRATRQGSSVLRDIPAEVLFDDPCGFALADFLQLRDLYHQASTRDEIVLVGD